MAPGALTGVLLVGGASRRFGSPKALAQLDGETLAERAWRILGETCDERIAVGKASDGIELPFPIVDDNTEARAPIAGVVAGLRAANNDICVVVPVDMPFLTAELLRTLAGACADADAAIARRTPLPLAARVRPTLAVLERRLVRGRLTLHEALSELGVEYVDVDLSQLVNVNTEEELAVLARRWPAIVDLTAEHVPGFVRLVEETLPEFGFSRDPAYDVDLASPLSYYRAAWVVVEDDRVVGSVALRDLGRGVLELKRMYLRRHLRGRGLGRRLLETALRWARDDGAERVVLDTTEQMEAARRLYEQYGFERVPGEAPRQGRPRLLYELMLRPE